MGESLKSSLLTWSVNALMTALFGSFVALAINVKQKDSSAVKSKVYPLLGRAFDSAALLLKARGRAPLSATGNRLSAFWCLILRRTLFPLLLRTFSYRISYSAIVRDSEQLPRNFVQMRLFYSCIYVPSKR